MATANKKLEDGKQFRLGHIEYLEYQIEKFETNEADLDRAFCKEQIHSLEHILAKYRSELIHIQSELVSLGN